MLRKRPLATVPGPAGEAAYSNPTDHQMDLSVSAAAIGYRQQTGETEKGEKGGKG